MALTTINNPLDENFLTDRASSGLQFIVNPKPGFSKTMGIFGVRFGSTDCTFSVDGKEMELPGGTAHFLEHKLFESQDGDVSDLYAANGASCNAGTGFTTTSYLFSCTDRLIDNLKLLLQFVQTPYFTPELIAKEQGIIAQEIKMYNDDPDWIVFFNLMRSLYRDHPVRQNIAGTLDSIAKIDPELLHRCCKAYYRPGNMFLVLVGNLDPEEVSRIIHEDAAERDTDNLGLSPRMINEKNPDLARREVTQRMVVARPKVLLGFKDRSRHSDGWQLQTKEIVTQMVIDNLFGKSSVNYEALYAEGVIDESFSAYYSGYLDFGFTLVGGDTDDPSRLLDRIRELTEQVVRRGIDPDDFVRQKNKYLGKFIRTFNSIESTAFSLLNLHFKKLSPRDVIEIINGITLDDLNQRLKNHFDPEGLACSIIEPESSLQPDSNPR